MRLACRQTCTRNRVKSEIALDGGQTKTGWPGDRAEAGALPEVPPAPSGLATNDRASRFGLSCALRNMLLRERKESALDNCCDSVSSMGVGNGYLLHVRGDSRLVSRRVGHRGGQSDSRSKGAWLACEGRSPRARDLLRVLALGFPADVWQTDCCKGRTKLHRPMSSEDDKKPLTRDASGEELQIDFSARREGLPLSRGSIPLLVA